MDPVDKRLKRALDGVETLAARIHTDRGVAVGVREILLASHVAGVGFVEPLNVQGQAQSQAQGDEESLFIKDNESDGEY